MSMIDFGFPFFSLQHIFFDALGITKPGGCRLVCTLHHCNAILNSTGLCIGHDEILMTAAEQIQEQM